MGDRYLGVCIELLVALAATCLIHSCRFADAGLQPTLINEDELIGIRVGDPLEPLVTDRGWNEPSTPPADGSQGPALSVQVDAYRFTADAEWQPITAEENEHGVMLYQIWWQHPPDEAESVGLMMHVEPVGCSAAADGTFGHYIWSFRDGTVAYGTDEAARELTHIFEKIRENDYKVIRVQLQDAQGNLVYGDSHLIAFSTPL